MTPAQLRTHIKKIDYRSSKASDALHDDLERSKPSYAKIPHSTTSNTGSDGWRTITVLVTTVASITIAMANSHTTTSFVRRCSYGSRSLALSQVAHHTGIQCRKRGTA